MPQPEPAQFSDTPVHDAMWAKYSIKKDKSWIDVADRIGKKKGQKFLKEKDKKEAALAEKSNNNPGKTPSAKPTATPAIKTRAGKNFRGIG
jgi:hypothetical protein